MNLKDNLRRAARVVEWERRPEVLLGLQIPKPMHEVNPRTILGRAWWDETRRAAYRSTAYHCTACGVWRYDAPGRRWLEGHELYEIDYLLGRVTYLETVPLCHYCHNYIHRGRLGALLDEGKISHQKYAAIIQHGDQVLKDAGLTREDLYTGPIADWGDWRLVLNGKEHPPVYQTAYDWIQEH